MPTSRKRTLHSSLNHSKPSVSRVSVIQWLRQHGGETESLPDRIRFDLKGLRFELFVETGMEDVWVLSLPNVWWFSPQKDGLQALKISQSFSQQIPFVKCVLHGNRANLRLELQAPRNHFKLRWVLRAAIDMLEQGDLEFFALLRECSTSLGRISSVKAR
jgi:hypothetical protein